MKVWARRVAKPAYWAVTCMLIGGCSDETADRINLALARVMMPRPEVVILGNETRLSAGLPTLMSLKQALKVKERPFWVCLALKDGVPSGSMQSMNAEFKALLGDANITIGVILPNQERVPLSRMGQAWSKFGHMLKEDELSTCAQSTSALPAGMEFSGVSVSTDRDLKVAGVYILP